MTEDKKYKLPQPGSFTAERRPTLRTGMKRKLCFELTPRAHDLLRTDAGRRGMTQIMLLELMIRDYCGKKADHGKRAAL